MIILKPISDLKGGLRGVSESAPRGASPHFRNYKKFLVFVVGVVLVVLNS